MRKEPGRITTSGTYSWSFVTQIFHNGQPSHGVDRKIFEAMTSNLPKGTLDSVASLLTATLYQGNPDRNHTLWNIVSSERYIYSICRCCWNVATYKWKVHNGKIEIIYWILPGFLYVNDVVWTNICQKLNW